MVDTINSILTEAENKFNDTNVEEQEVNTVKVPINKSNVVTGEKLRAIQKTTLSETAGYLSNTFGPMGSNTKIIKGTSQADISSSYSKDGLKVLGSIINSSPIEASIVEELVDITKAVEKEVGDGTTSTVILSSLIFDKLTKIENEYNIPPYQLIRLFGEVVENIKKEILNNGRECTLDDIYNIAMISTNGNTEVSTNIKNIYEEFGMDVDLSVGISNNTDSVIKVYDGLTITEGMSDPAFINNRTDNTSEIHNAKIYHFEDPIDTMDQVVLFDAIINHNIYEPYANQEPPIPTVITCPKLSRDTSSIMKKLVSQLYQYDQSSSESSKPPILIITNVIASDELIMDDIATLCGCKSIKKYIDPNIYAADVEAGLAPTVDNVFEFCGEAELVVADSKKTKFINPAHMMINDNGEVKEDPVYTSMINFLTTEIENTKASDDAHSIGLLKKRLSALKSNMVDYLVGGVTISERDAIKDLVEDAIKNCKSASMYNVGYAANFEGLRASYKVLNDYYDKVYSADESEVKIAAIQDIALCIFKSYFDIAAILYGTVEFDKDKVKEYIIKSLDNNMPYDISDAVLSDDNKGDNVLCSIMLDINILDTLSKIITMMCTSNQCLLQASHLNVY